MRKFLTFLFAVLALSASCQDSLFLNSEGPPRPEEDNPVELGTVFSPRVNGTITHFRFYKTQASDASQFTLNLWNAYGVNAVRQKMTAPGLVGWIRVPLTTPAKVSAGSHYVVSVHFSAGRYGGRTGVFTSARVRGNLTAPSSVQAGGNGRYRYGATTGFPAQTFNSSAYYVDVVFVADVPPAKPLVVNAGRDTIFASRLDGVIPDFQLHGSVSGDSVSFSWTKLGPLDLFDTMLNANTLNPILRGLVELPHAYVLRASDKWGKVAQDTVTVEVIINPKKVVFTLMKNGQPFAELYQDGSWRELTGTSDGQWFFLGSLHPGFQDEDIEQPPPE
jgi:hypothetical protein